MGGAQVVFYPNDPLWDGQGCGTSTCCTFSNPPWFCKQLPQATTDDIEIRLCGTYYESVTQEDTPIELMEIYEIRLCHNGLTGGSEDTPIELIEIFIQ